MLIGSQLQGWVEEEMLGCVKSQSPASWKSPNLGQELETFSPSPMLFQVIADRVSAPRGEGGKNLHQIHQISPLKLASTARSPLFCGDDLIELLLLPSFLASRGVGLVSNLSAATPHRATQSPTLFPPKRQPCRRALVAGPCSRNLAPFRESHL